MGFSLYDDVDGGEGLEIFEVAPARLCVLRGTRSCPVTPVGTVAGFVD